MSIHRAGALTPGAPAAYTQGSTAGKKTFIAEQKDKMLKLFDAGRLT